MQSTDRIHVAVDLYIAIMLELYPVLKTGHQFDDDYDDGMEYDAGA